MLHNGCPSYLASSLSLCSASSTPCSIILHVRCFLSLSSASSSFLATFEMEWKSVPVELWWDLHIASRWNIFFRFSAGFVVTFDENYFIKMPICPSEHPPSRERSWEVNWRPTTNVPRTSHERLTNVAVTSHDRPTNVPRTSHERRSNLPVTSHIQFGTAVVTSSVT